MYSATRQDLPTDVPRRQFLLRADDWALLPRDPVTTSRLYADFQEASGIDHEELMTSPMSKLPLPFFHPHLIRDGDAYDIRKRFRHINASFMWHPIMWLPTELTKPRFSENDNGYVDAIEDSESAMVRIFLELSAAGMYDTATGGWLDVLGLYGLASTDQRTHSRVAAWLAGEADPVLDSIDLSPYFAYPEAQDWALLTATEIREPLLGASYYRVAEDSLTILDVFSDPVRYTDTAHNGDSLTPLRTEVTSLLKMAEVMYRSVDSSDFKLPDGYTTMVDVLAEHRAKVQGFSGSYDEFIDEAIPPLTDLFTAIRTEYVGFLRVLLDIIHAYEDLGDPSDPAWAEANFSGGNEPDGEEEGRELDR
ncbi:hypothetical protein GCM10009689_17610 [Brevibacterium antiquum]